MFEPDVCGVIEEALSAKEYVSLVTNAFTAWLEVEETDRGDTIREWDEKYEQRIKDNVRQRIEDLKAEDRELPSPPGGWRSYQPTGVPPDTKGTPQTYLATLKTVEGELDFLLDCHPSPCGKHTFCDTFSERFHTWKTGEQTRAEYLPRLSKRHARFRPSDLDNRTYTIGLPSNKKEACDQTYDIKMIIIERINEIERGLRHEFPDVWKKAVVESQEDLFDTRYDSGTIRLHIKYCFT